MTMHVASEGHIWRLGDSFLVEAFFKTTSRRLEHGHPGERFPLLLALSSAAVPAWQVPRLREELSTVQSELSQLHPRWLVWEFAPPAPRRPWNIGLPNLSQCFVDSGLSLFAMFDLALAYAIEHRQPVKIF